MAGKKNILLIDDNATVTALIKSYIEREHVDYNITVASDGSVGLDMIQELKPDLVILDIMIPKVSGIEIFNKISTGKLGVTAPVLMFTAREEMRDFFEQLGAAGFVSKPFDMGILVSEIKRILANKEKPMVYLVSSQDRARIEPIKKVFRQNAYQFALIRDMDALTQEAHKRKPDYLFLDYENNTLNVQDPVSAIKRALFNVPDTKQSSGQKLKVIVFAYSSADNSEKVLSAGADKYVANLTAPEGLITAVHELLQALHAKKEERLGLFGAAPKKPSITDLDFFK